MRARVNSIVLFPCECACDGGWDPCGSGAEEPGALLWCMGTPFSRPLAAGKEEQNEYRLCSTSSCLRQFRRRRLCTGKMSFFLRNVQEGFFSNEEQASGVFHGFCCCFIGEARMRTSGPAGTSGFRPSSALLHRHLLLASRLQRRMCQSDL